MKILKKILILSLIGIFIPSPLYLREKVNYEVSVNADKNEGQIKVARILANLSIDESPNGVILLPEQVPPVIRDVFNRYTRVTAPNGKPIHLLAQSGWTEDQILKARNVLQHLLTDHPGSVYGNNKAAVANAMADKNAAMVLFNTQEELENVFNTTPLEKVDLSMQDLRANECPADGDEDYMNHITRDAAFEEIWHLVHDYGVKAILPEMLTEMRKTNDAAAKKGWRAWPENEPQEHPNDISQGPINKKFLRMLHGPDASRAVFSKRAPWPPEAAGCCTLFTVVDFSFVRCTISNLIGCIRRMLAAGGK